MCAALGGRPALSMQAAVTPPHGLGGAVGAALGVLDVAYMAACRLAGDYGVREQPKFFSRGWGELAPARALLGRLTARVRERGRAGGGGGGALGGGPLTPHSTLLAWPLTIKWRPWAGPAVPGMRAAEGFFPSPLASELPVASHTAQCLFLWPAGAETEAEAEAAGGRPAAGALGAVVVHMAASGEEDYAERARLAGHLCAATGAASLILAIPHYGPRRPPGQTGHYIETVGQYMLNAAACMSEGASLLSWAGANYPRAKLAITGFSFGGAMAAGAALLHGGRNVAVAPYVGSVSPELVLTGLMQQNVDWAALCAEGLTEGEARAKLMAVFREFNHLRILEEACPEEGQARGLIAASHVVLSSHDHFVRLEHQRDLVKFLAAATAEGQASWEWTSGGHVSSHFMRKTQAAGGQAAGILKALAKLTTP